MNVTISISTFKIGSGRAERKVSPDCRPPSIVTALNPSKILSEPCSTDKKSLAPITQEREKIADERRKTSEGVDARSIFTQAR